MLLGGTFEFRFNNLGNWKNKEIIDPTRTEKIIENPTDMPSIFTKIKSKAIRSGFKFTNKKKNETRRINEIK